jgi:ABC-2 type transport system permease protein
VYENFTNTIALLKKLGIYNESKIDISNINEVIVHNYYPGYDLEVTPVSELPSTVETSDSTSKTYIDEESIKEILAGCLDTNYYNQWYNYSRNNEQYSVEITMKGDRYGYSSVYYSFLKGKVPEFVKEDTN